MKIIVDAFGGDNAPLAMIEGSLQAHREYGVQILLVGERDKIEQCAKEHNLPLGRHRDFGGTGHDSGGG